MTHLPRTTALAIAVSIALAAGASAQSLDNLVELDDDVQVTALNASADAIEDMAVNGPDGKKIGEVEEVLGTNGGTPSALAVDFEGAFGDREGVVVPLANFTAGNGALMLNASEADVATYDTHDD